MSTRTAACALLILLSAGPCSCGGKGSGATPKPPSAAPGAAVKQEAPESGTKGGSIIHDGEYTIIAIPKNLEIGKRRLTIASGGAAVEFTETVGMEYEGTEVGWETRVTYAMEPAVAPVSAEGKTFLRKNEVTRGTLAFAGGSVEIEASLLFDEDTGALAEPVKKTISKQLSGSLVLFQSAIQVLGPLLLKEPGEINNITFAEFPDDVDSLVNFKGGYRLIREAAQPDGSFVIKLLPSAQEGYSDEPAIIARFDAKGACLSEEFQKVRFVPAGA